MKCPYCSKEMEKGEVKVVDTTFNILSNVTWYPQEEIHKKIKRNWVNLKHKAEGYYCSECMKVVSIFDEK